MRWLDLLQSGAVAKSYTSFTVGASQLFGPAKQTLAKTAAYDRFEPILWKNNVLRAQKVMR
jgi:hypothetical protein